MSIKANFDRWFPIASGFTRNAGYAVRDGDSNLADFLLHQAAERFYHCALLTMTLYSTAAQQSLREAVLGTAAAGLRRSAFLGPLRHRQ
jgi:hypothetical protein